jgi:hypothetical protein
MLFFTLVMLAVITAASAVFLTIIIVGMRQEHPTTLAVRGPTCLATLVRLVLGLYVRKAEPMQHAGPTSGDGEPVGIVSLDAREVR